MACTISRMGWIWRMDVSELTTKAINRMMAEVMKNSPINERHICMSERFSITARMMPTSSPDCESTAGTPTTYCLSWYMDPRRVRPS